MLLLQLSFFDLQFPDFIQLSSNDCIFLLKHITYFFFQPLANVFGCQLQNIAIAAGQSFDIFPQFLLSFSHLLDLNVQTLQTLLHFLGPPFALTGFAERRQPRKGYWLYNSWATGAYRIKLIRIFILFFNARRKSFHQLRSSNVFRNTFLTYSRLRPHRLYFYYPEEPW